MKKFLTLIACLQCASLFSQVDSTDQEANDRHFKNGVKSQLGHQADKDPKNAGWGYLAMGGFLEKGQTTVHPSVGVGVRNDMAGVGVAFYYNKYLHLSVHGDFRVILTKSRSAAPFISFQPGILLYNQSTRVGSITIKEKGGFAFNALAGVMGKGKRSKVGPYFAVGYGEYRITVTGGSKPSSGKATGGIILGGITI